MKVPCTCGCCGNEELIELNDLDSRNVDRADYVVPMCTSCIDQSRIDVTSETEPKVIAEFRHIKEKGYATVKYKGRSILIDTFSASAVILVWDNLSEKNRQDWITKTDSDPAIMADMAFKLINRTNEKARVA